MARFGFCGPSYSSQSLNADAEKTVNWYVESIESGQGKSAFALYQKPGLSLFTTLPGMLNVRSLDYMVVATGSRLFAVGETLTSQVLFEVRSDGSLTNRGILGGIGNPATMAYNNGNQMMVSSGGRLFLYDLAGNVLSEMDTTTGGQLQGPVGQIGFSDSYFIALLSNSQKFQISGLLDGSSWDPADIAEVSVFPDNVLSMIIDHREVVFFGAKASVVYENTGAALFPFEVNPAGFAEVGTITTWPPVKLDNSVFWWGGDERGSIMGWRANGYTPVRVSNHAVEYALQQYPTVSDAESYSFQFNGHAIWRTRFPSANKTWDYDVATQMWTEASSLVSGRDAAHLSRCHAFAFGKHLVGDWNSGKIYEMSDQFLDDAGTPIIRIRRAPYIATEQQKIFHHSLQLDIEVGPTPQPPLVDAYGQPRDPQVMLRWSDDGAKTWSNEHWTGFGQAGNYTKRVIWRRLGASRFRVYEVKISDPVPCRIVEAYLKATPGFPVPTERLAKQLVKAQ